jgi:ribA/ribD-fused uncharacterized protein
MRHADSSHVSTLAARHAAGERLKYLFFWGHTPARRGTIDKACLSQWWPAPFVVDGKRFATAEHFMMYEKARLFGDDASAEAILRDDRPPVAKELGRSVRGFVDDVWQAARFDIVVRGSVAKFGQHDALKEYLLATGHLVLVEASPTDRVWGIGLAATDEHAEQPARWRGLNLLGFALMEARRQLATADVHADVD